MKKIIDRIRKNKLLTVLFILIFVSVVLGVLFPAFLVEDNKKIVKFVSIILVIVMVISFLSVLLYL